MSLLRQRMIEDLTIRNYSPRTIKIKVCLDKPGMIEHIPFPKQPKKLPVVLSREEVPLEQAGLASSVSPPVRPPPFRGRNRSQDDPGSAGTP